jgi:NADH-quinone oxidoreductase subunit L
MITHAFFKALLFLGAGSVIHALHDEQDMKKMGALRRYLPITFPTFLIGYLALSGIPPFDGFWSKDAILDSAWHMSPYLWAVGAVTAGLTAYYMTRLMVLTFSGQARWGTASAADSSAVPLGDGEHDAHAGPAGDHGHDGHGGDPHESPWVMTAPLVILAGAAALGWLLNAPFGGLDFVDKWLAPVFPASIAPAVHVATATKWYLGTIVTVICFAGVGLGWVAWRQVERPALEPAFLAHGWYIDEAIAATVSGPLAAAADDLAYEVDATLVEGLVDGVATLAAQTGRQLRRLQTGYVRNYALGIGVGAVALLAFVAMRAGS